MIFFSKNRGRFLVSLALFSMGLSLLAPSPAHSLSSVEIQSVVVQLLKPKAGVLQNSGFCRSKGQVGNTAEDAIQKCTVQGWARSTCESDLTCDGSNAGFCRSKGQVGNTAEDAIQKCTGQGWARSTCESDLTCNGNNAGFCRSKGQVGNTAEDAIQKCNGQGWARSTCESDLTCTHGL